MRTQVALGRLDHLSFKGNLKATRFGWLRLTPAYSVHLVAEILEDLGSERRHRVLDPYCGTGTTALVCAERGIDCDTTDINPFLVWLATMKARTYAARELKEARSGAEKVSSAIKNGNSLGGDWVPPLHQIEKWWDARTLSALAAAMKTVGELDVSTPARDLLKIAFCRMMIERANVSFGHQSMSFKKKGSLSLSLLADERNEVAESWARATESILAAATSPLTATPKVIECDARDLTAVLKRNIYDCVITSPPYPNRMSYIRELRPYMYWLGFLKDGREAGELDWKAIGGTWGCATSNVGKWTPPQDLPIPHRGFDRLLGQIAETSPLLSRYVHKYFYDMVQHCAELFKVVAPGGTIHYVVGNSKFYEVLLPVEQIFASLFSAAGFEASKVKTIRKRSSKKELFEYVVSATKPHRS